MQIKTTVRDHYTLIRKNKMFRLTKPSSGEDKEQLELSYISDRYIHLEKQIASLLKS